ncbi:MAG: IclR family transcriptional regulator [Deltaproteobacteria bacterium]|nr:IclR family transcriptional regulator [Deltaproteobacteria bacterium]
MNQNKKIEPVYRVQAVERTLDILDCFSFEKREMSLAQIARNTGLHKTTAKRLIANLMARDYLHQDLATKNYTLGLRLFELGGIVFTSFSLRKAAAPHMTHLRNETGATVILGINMDNQLVYIDRRGGTGMIYVTSEIGWIRPLHFGMLGRVLMAYLDEEVVDKILIDYPLEKNTPFSITDNQTLKRHLQTIRKQGYAIEKEQAVEGTTGIAAPIRDYSRKVIAALGVALTPGRRAPIKDLNTIVDMVKKACDDISTDLGYLKI